jgi:hypothetical protein
VNPSDPGRHWGGGPLVATTDGAIQAICGHRSVASPAPTGWPWRQGYGTTKREGRVLPVYSQLPVRQYPSEPARASQLVSPSHAARSRVNKCAPLPWPRLACELPLPPPGSKIPGQPTEPNGGEECTLARGLWGALAARQRTLTTAPASRFVRRYRQPRPVALASRCTLLRPCRLND